MLPNEIIDRISKELFGIDLFHFTLANESHLAISNYHLIQLLRLKSNIKLDKEIKSLLDMSKSPYMIVQNGIGLVLSSYKWSDFVYGAFKFNMIQKSLKYYSTTTFFLYCRLWSFTPFYYEASYPTLDIFAYSYLLEPRTLCDEEYALFKTFGYNQSKPDIVNNFDQFLQNFTSRYDYHTWSTYIDWNLFIIAGGSVVLSLLARPLFQNTSDIDLFFLKESEHLFKISVDELESRLQNEYFVRRKTIWFNRLVQFDLYRKFTINDIFHDKNFAPSLIIQLIRPTTTPTNISRIIHSFDLDICAAAFNSKKVIISFACLQALNSGFTTCYAVPFSTSEFMKRAPRFYKYQQRGFNILIPQQFDINKFLATPVEDCKETRPEQIYRFRRRHFGDNCDSFSIQKKFCEYYNLI
ncbi:unnamed protein product [Rotaria magnacalcarata]|uniref:Uncharacterized protein n=1 Tax=Rotaria magnacalcarata TaxID=392030 RepID=A0A816NYI5_9BILA|nr:unnamed protein product [Rotaria magnacalcarata]CAF1406013.1 unnamed protein product [Rotaria magnacalcarata]CAF2041805.1 unnamed protein product [Rotaria magnacalcarata]